MPYPFISAVLSPVASLRLVSPGAVTDGVAFFYLTSDDLFSQRPTDYRHHSHASDVLGDRLSSVLVNSSAKTLFGFSSGCHPLNGVTRGAPPSDVLSFALFGRNMHQTYSTWIDNILQGARKMRATNSLLVVERYVGEFLSSSSVNGIGETLETQRQTDSRLTCFISEWAKLIKRCQR